MLFGWSRPSLNAAWVIVAEGDTLDETHEKLLAKTLKESEDSRNRMITAGQHPDSVLLRVLQLAEGPKDENE